jgi:hypothetical protein
VLLAVQPSALDAIHPAFTHTKEQLIHPFRLGQWVRLAIVGLLAGEMGTAGCSIRLPFDFNSSESRHLLGPNLFGEHPLLLAAIIAAAVLLVLTLWLIFVYISSRMRFVLFDSIVARHCRVRHYWRQRGEPAFRYFVWQILFFVGALLAITVVLAPPLIIAAAAGWFGNPSAHLAPLILGGIAIVLIAIALIISLALIHVLTKDFVVPQMALERATVMEGWKRLWALIVAEKGGYAAYAGMKIVLTIATGIVTGIVGIVIVLLLLIPVGGIGVIAVFAGQTVGLTWNPATIAMAIVAGAIVLLAVISLFSMISVPLIVFFPAYSVHFFAGRYPLMKHALNPQSAPL